MCRLYMLCVCIVQMTHRAARFATAVKSVFERKKCIYVDSSSANVQFVYFSGAHMHFSRAHHMCMCILEVFCQNALITR